MDRAGLRTPVGVCRASPAVSGRLHDPHPAAGDRVFRRDAAPAARAPLVAVRHAPLVVGAGARPGPLLRTVYGDLAAFGPEFEGAQGVGAVDARSRSAECALP